MTPEEGRIIEDEEIKRSLSQAAPYEEWLSETQFKLEELALAAEPETPPVSNDPATLLDRQQAFGYTQEDLQFFLEPMAKTGDDPLGSMGFDTPIAVLSRRPKLLYDSSSRTSPRSPSAHRPDPRGVGDEHGLDDPGPGQICSVARRARTSVLRSPGPP